MYKIGEFSGLGQVSVRMLRHYDQMGLLKPDSIDADTGYRSYSVKQLPRLNRILFLKDLGFSLQQVKELLNKELPADQMKEMFEDKQDALEKEITEARHRLEQVNLRLEQIQNEGKAPLYEVLVKKSEAFVLASIRKMVPHISEMDYYCRTIHSELYAALENCGIKPAGPEISFYHTREYTETDLDVEVGIKLAADYRGKIELPAELEIKTIPEEKKTASLLYRGPYRNTVSGVMALLNWIGLNKWHIKGALREIHISGPAHQEGIVQAEPVSELQIPIEA